MKSLALADLGFFCEYLPHLRPLQAMTRSYHLNISMDGEHGHDIYTTGIVVVPRGVIGWRKYKFSAKKQNN